MKSKPDIVLEVIRTVAKILLNTSLNRPKATSTVCYCGHIGIDHYLGVNSSCSLCRCQKFNRIVERTNEI